MIWHLDHVVWAIALALTPASAPEPATATPVVATVTVDEVESTAKSQVGSEVVADIDAESEAIIAQHWEIISNLHFARHATMFGQLAREKPLYAAEYTRGDIVNLKWWRAEWDASGVVDHKIDAEYAHLLELFTLMLAEFEAGSE